MKRCDCYSPIDGSPPGVSPGDGPDILIFTRALPIGGFVLAAILEGFFPLADCVSWFPTPVRGFLAVVVLLTGLLFFAAGHLALSGAGKNAGAGRPAAHVVEKWPFSWSRHPMYLGLLVMFAGAGLASRLYWMLVLLPLLAGDLPFWRRVARGEIFGAKIRAGLSKLPGARPAVGLILDENGDRERHEVYQFTLALKCTREFSVERSSRLS